MPETGLSYQVVLDLMRMSIYLNKACHVFCESVFFTYFGSQERATRIGVLYGFRDLENKLVDFLDSCEMFNDLAQELSIHPDNGSLSVVNGLTPQAYQEETMKLKLHMKCEFKIKSRSSSSSASESTSHEKLELLA